MSFGVGIGSKQAYVIDHVSRQKRRLGKKNTVLVASDGVFIALGDEDGKIRVYWARNQRFIRRIAARDLNSLNFVDGNLTVGFSNGTFDIVDLKGVISKRKNPYERLQEKFT